MQGMHHKLILKQVHTAALKFDSGIQEALERHLPTGVKIPGTVVFIENINEIYFTQRSVAVMVTLGDKD